MRKLSAILAIGCLVFSTQAQADPFTRYAVFGFGKDSCGKFVATYQVPKEKIDSRTLAYMSFVNGFVTGINMSMALDAPKGGLPLSVGSNLDIYGQMMWIRQYCLVHPDETFAAATSLLYSHMAESGL